MKKCKGCKVKIIPAWTWCQDCESSQNFKRKFYENSDGQVVSIRTRDERLSSVAVRKAGLSYQQFLAIDELRHTIDKLSSVLDGYQRFHTFFKKELKPLNKKWDKLNNG